MSNKSEDQAKRGRPHEMDKGGPRRVYLDAESIEIANRIGKNTSEGIRIALKAYAASERR